MLFIDLENKPNKKQSIFQGTVKFIMDRTAERKFNIYKHFV